MRSHARGDFPEEPSQFSHLRFGKRLTVDSHNRAMADVEFCAELVPVPGQTDESGSSVFGIAGPLNSSVALQRVQQPRQGAVGQVRPLDELIYGAIAQFLHRVQHARQAGRQTLRTRGVQGLVVETAKA